jgi:hypothetical protein
MNVRPGQQRELSALLKRVDAICDAFEPAWLAGQEQETSAARCELNDSRSNSFETSTVREQCKH